MTLLAWVHASVPPGFGGVVQLPGVVELSVQPGGVKVRAFSAGLAAEATAPLVLPTGEWCLIGMCYEPDQGRVRVFARSESSGATVWAESIEPTMLGSSLGPVAGELAIGHHPDGLPGFVGAYGTTVLRDHAIDVSDIDAVWSSRSFWAPYDLNNLSAGGHLTGTAGCAWMTNHSVTTEPVNASGAPGSFDRAAILGEPATLWNIHVYDRTFFWPNEWDLTRIARQTTAVSGFTYETHREQPYASHFIVQVPDEGIPAQFVAREAPLSRQLVTGPKQTLRVIASGNSRAVRNSDGTGKAPGTFISGFTDRNLAKVSGVLNRPTLMGSGGSPWFGFDTKAQNPLSSALPEVMEVGSETATHGDFGRFWSGQGNPATRGPGAGVLIPANGFYGLRCKPEPGSLLLATEPLIVQAYVLMYPGSSAADWMPDQGVSQRSIPQKSHPKVPLVLDTTNRTYTLTTDDWVSGAAKLILRSPEIGLVLAGEACHISAGPGAGSISIVKSVEPFGEAYIVEFTHPMGGLPGVGSELRFGPWGIETVTHEWPGLDPAEKEDWRGIRFDAGPTGSGVVVFAYNAWRPNVHGFVFGIAGWSGHGYEEQIEESTPEIIGTWMKLVAPDVWIQTFAQQRTKPPIMTTYAGLIQGALPGVELIWAGEMAHHLSTLAAWHEYILENAGAQGVIALSILEDPRLGTVWEQYSDNLRTDIGHLTLRGNRLVADLWTEMLAQAALDPCEVADFEQDGDYDIFDFLAFQDGIVNQDPRADVEGDGDWDVFDFLAFQNLFVGCAA